MTTLIVTVDNKKNAHLLTKMLKSMVFVKNIEEDPIVSQQKDQFTLLNGVLKTIDSNSLFHSINDPVEWQKKIRDEWEVKLYNPMV